jgi:hypothetical protein
VPKPTPTPDDEDHGKTLFHYTGYDSARSIAASQTIRASAGFRGTYTYPIGAYATEIAPLPTSGYTQRQLSALFYGGNQNRDVSYYVEIEQADFYPILYPGITGQVGSSGPLCWVSGPRHSCEVGAESDAPLMIFRP